MSTILTDTDSPDLSSSNDKEIDNWPVESKMESLMALTDHDLSMDEYMLEEYSTDTDLDEPVSNEQRQVSDEQQQQQEEEEEEQQQQLDFKMPEKPSSSKSKKVPLRRQKSRACKAAAKSHIEEFSDDADLY